MNENSKLITKAMGALYPLILIFGFYIVMNGHLSPGGGFQGGALIMAAYICRYIANPTNDLSLKTFKTIEKVALILILLFALAFLATFLNTYLPILNVPYLMLMNILIAFKVACGLIIIFYRFVLYEVR